MAPFGRMNIARIFAHAVVRRIAYVLVALVLAYAGIRKAHAGQLGCDVNAGCDQGEAYEKCMIHLPTYFGWGNPGPPKDCRKEQQNAYLICQVGGVCAGTPGAATWYYFDVNKTCAARQPALIPSADRAGTYGCMQGCEAACVSGGPNGADVCYFGDGVCATNKPFQCLAGDVYNATKGMCESPAKKCAVDEKLVGDKCIPRQQCPDGQKADATGECRVEPTQCTAPQVKGPDGTCISPEQACPDGQSRNDAGVCEAGGDDDADDDDHEASGGDSCAAPPACSGDAILCLQTRIQWRIDCNTRKSRTVTGGACSTMPICQGEKCDSLEYSQLVLTWRSTCALEKLGQGTPANGTAGDHYDQNNNGQPDWTENTEEPVMDHGDPGSAADGKREVEVGGDGFDDSGYGWGRSCPALPSAIPLPGGHSLDIDTSVVCDWISLGGIFVLLIASLTSLAILFRA